MFNLGRSATAAYNGAARGARWISQCIWANPNAYSSQPDVKKHIEGLVSQFAAATPGIDDAGAETAYIRSTMHQGGNINPLEPKHVTVQFAKADGSYIAHYVQYPDGTWHKTYGWHVYE